MVAYKTNAAAPGNVFPALYIHFAAGDENNYPCPALGDSIHNP
jgi:hypothetical protein